VHNQRNDTPILEVSTCVQSYWRSEKPFSLFCLV